MRAGVKLGAAVLIVIAGETDENMAAVAFSATMSNFTDVFSNSEPAPAVRVESSVDTLSGPREDRPYSERAEKSGETAGGREARAEAGGDVLGSVADHTNGASAVSEEPPGDACPPLTVVVGHEEGIRVLEWIRGVRSAVTGDRRGDDDGGGHRATASLAAREDVGRLWGDVLWASDPLNWPAGGWMAH